MIVDVKRWLNKDFKITSTKQGKRYGRAEILLGILFFLVGILIVSATTFIIFMVLWGLGLYSVLDGSTMLEICDIYDAGLSPEMVPPPR